MSGHGTTPEDEALLVAYCDGDLSLVECAAFEQRLANEPALVAALQDLLVADDLGRLLASSQLLPKAQRSPLPRWTLWAATAMAAAAVAIGVLWVSARPTARFQLTEVDRRALRGPDDKGASEIDFRIEIHCTTECYALLLAVPSTEAAVIQMQPPFASDPPFAAGSSVVLPPDSKKFTRLEGDLVVLCKKTDGPFTPEVIGQVKAAVQADVKAWRNLPPDAPERPTLPTWNLLRSDDRAGWQVECREVTAGR